MPTEFKRDERGYLEWLDANPHGYVINTTRSMSPSYMVLHRATCPTISQYNQMCREGGFTERDYIKVCALTHEELRDWVRGHGRPDGSFSSEGCYCQT